MLDEIPVLRRFYGGSLAEWIAMPLRLFLVHRNNLQRLQAREQLAMVTAFAIGSCSLSKESSDRIVGQWEKQAGIKAEKPSNVREFKSALAGMGIGYKEVKRG